MELSRDIRDGKALYGNDFTPDAIAAWYEDERQGFYLLDRDLYGAQEPDTFETRALNAAHGKSLQGFAYPLCLALGCATGEDILALHLEIGKIIALEPARGFWRSSIGEVPADYREPRVDGIIDLPDDSVDLIVAIGVLHHIPNVETVVAELARVLKPGGSMIVREPVISMGDFTRPRHGLTRNERGIPIRLLTSYMENACLRIDHRGLCDSPVITRPIQKLGLKPFNYPVLVRIDALVSRLSAWNLRYWRAKPWHKLAPTCAVFVARKTGS